MDKMKYYYKEYIGFGIVSLITSFWHSLTLLVIYLNQFRGWFFVLVSICIMWGMYKYIKWLYKPSTRSGLFIYLSASQIIPSVIFFLIFVLNLKMK